MQISLIRSLFSTEQLVKATRALDRTAVIMILAVWIGAVVMVGVALYTVSLAHKARQQTDEAVAVEPAVPEMQKAALPRIELDKYAERLRTRFGKITFNALPDNGLEVTAADASTYLDWLTAMSYLDTIAPQVRWAVRDLCVGTECGSGSMMRATVVGERITFRKPEKAAPTEEVKDKKP